MVPCLHQSNVYIKKKLRVWRVQKCIPLVGAKISIPGAGLQTTLSQVSQYRAELGNLRKSRSTFGHSTEFAPKQCFYVKRNLWVWTVKKCIPLVSAKTSFTCPAICIPLVGTKTSIPSVGLQTTLSEVSQYKAENINLRKSVSTFSHGTVFASKKCLYQKEATSIETPKMYYSSRCKNLSYLYRTANNPISSKPV